MLSTKRVAFVALAAMASWGVAGAARALSTSDRPASILVWPKIIVDTAGTFTGGAPVNTLITLSNTDSANPKQAHCFLVNANGHCASDAARVCRTAADCVTGATRSECIPGWNEIDFDVNMTFEQPLAWYASSGLQRGQFPLEGPFFCNAPLNTVPCNNDGICSGFGCNMTQNNLGSGVPPVPEDPFYGSLTCIQFTGGNPSVPDESLTRNRLKGEAAIITNDAIPTASVSGVDVQKYNATGLLANGLGTSDNVLQIGGDTGAEYDPCPSTLILNHLFDGANDPISSATNQTVHTDLTLVPCGNNFAAQAPGVVTAQFLVFNEFEQRFSTSRTIDCFYESLISNIDTRNGARSIFGTGVAGTIAGQTRIRGVGSAPTGRGLLGVARVLVTNSVTGVDAGAAYNLHQQGNPAPGTQPDVITIP